MDSLRSESETRIMDPTQYKNWDEMLVSFSTSSFFHSSAWAQVLQASYGYMPNYFTLFRGGEIVAILPMMEIRSCMTGKRGVSLPFSDFCEPLINDDVVFGQLFDSIIGYGKSRGWRYAEFRGGRGVFEGKRASEAYFVHLLDLTKGVDGIFSHFRASTRRNINRARNEKIEITVSDSLNAVRHFYHLNCLTRKRHGLPVQPYRFFKNIGDYIIAKGLGILMLASYRGSYISGAIYFHFGKKALFKYGASDERYQNLRANNLIMWEGIRWYCNQGYDTLHFGRTDLSNQGLRQYKRGWGTEELMMHYYKYDILRETFAASRRFIDGIHGARIQKALSKMPISILRIIGSLSYGHSG